MHTGNRIYDVSLSREFQKYLYIAARNHGVIYQSKYKKRASKRKCTEREYHVQEVDDIVHKDVWMFLNTNQFPSLPFCVPH